MRVAVSVYGLSLLLASLTTSALWGWARHADLVRHEARDEDVRYITHRLTPGLAGYAAIIVLGLFEPVLAVIGYLLIALFFLVPVREIRASRRSEPPA